jgi:hypothetical protein
LVVPESSVPAVLAVVVGSVKLIKTVAVCAVPIFPLLSAAQYETLYNPAVEIVNDPEELAIVCVGPPLMV